MPKIQRPLWSAEHTDQLRELWEVRGLSAKECAAQLGMTRNAVIGRAHRMKFVHRFIGPHTSSYPRCAWPRKERKPKRLLPEGHIFSRAQRPRARLQTKIAARHFLRRTNNPLQFVVETGELTELVHEILAPPVSLWALQRHHCRWPVTGENGETHYCGLDKVAGSYCATHYRLAYTRTPRMSEAERGKLAMRLRKRITALTLRREG